MFRDATDEARTPKYAHIERERRWRIDPAARPALGDAHVLIEDRYLTGTRLRLRRMTDGQTGAVACKLTKKYASADPRARPIVTAYLDADEYALLAALPGRPIVKRRLPLQAGALTYSLDRFEGALAGLELAEIEWPDAAGLEGLPAPPGALGEVTDDHRYRGGTLARAASIEGLAWRIS